MLKKQIILVFFLLLLNTIVVAQENVTLDYKMHNAGLILQPVTNTGYCGFSQFIGWIPNAPPPEYPIGSGCGIGFQGGPWIAGKYNNAPHVSTAAHDPGFEFFPSGESWDTVWVIGRNEVVDIPYWPGYKGLSDQDMVCRYSDFPIYYPWGKSGSHDPHTVSLGLEVIQTSHAWSIPPFQKFILWQYYVIFHQDLDDVFLGWGGKATVGRHPQMLDDCMGFMDDYNIAYWWDTSTKTEDDGCPGPVGLKVYPPDKIDPVTIHYFYGSTEYHDIVITADEAFYEVMRTGKIVPYACLPYSVFFQISLAYTGIGPIPHVSAGDTLHYMALEVVGEGEAGMLKNMEIFEWLKSLNFQTPGPPPSPPVRYEIGNHQVTLRWDALEGQTDPEKWLDANRMDAAVEPQPFEGYRIYKSLKSKAGPWTLLAEYDIPDNPYGINSGLQRSYTDVGLLNNLEYYYAVTCFSKPDTISLTPSLESGTMLSALAITPGTPPPETVTGEIAVVPNPYRGDISYKDYKPSWEILPTNRQWYEADRRIQFINIPSPSEIKIYTLAGDLVQTIEHNDPSRGFADWNLTSVVGQTVASGIYLYTVEDKKNNKVFVGKFVIIK